MNTADWIFSQVEGSEGVSEETPPPTVSKPVTPSTKVQSTAGWIFSQAEQENPTVESGSVEILNPSAKVQSTADWVFSQAGESADTELQVSKPAFDPNARNYEIPPTLEEETARIRKNEELGALGYLKEEGKSFLKHGIPYLTKEFPAKAWETLKTTGRGELTWEDIKQSGIQNLAEWDAALLEGPYGGQRKVGRALDVILGNKATDEEIRKMWLDKVQAVKEANERMAKVPNPAAYETFQFVTDVDTLLPAGIAAKGVGATGRAIKKAVGIAPKTTEKVLTTARTAVGARPLAAVLDPAGDILNKVGSGAEKVEDVVGGATDKLKVARQGLMRTVVGAGVGAALGDVEGALIGATLGGGSAYAKGAGASLKATAKVLREGDTGEGTVFKRVSKDLADQGHTHAATVWSMADKMGVGRSAEALGRAGSTTAGVALVMQPVNYLLAGGDPDEAAMLTASSVAGAGVGAGLHELARGHLSDVWKTQYFNINARFLNKYKNSPLYGYLAQHAVENPNLLTLLSILETTNKSRVYTLTDNFARVVAELDAENKQLGLGKTDQQIYDEAGAKTQSGSFNPDEANVEIDISRPSGDIVKILGHEYTHFLRGTGVLDTRATIGLFEPETTTAGARLKSIYA
jgi:hypothetical protein